MSDRFDRSIVESNCPRAPDERRARERDGHPRYHGATRVGDRSRDGSCLGLREQLRRDSENDEGEQN
jgi:hypothetical protein